MQFTGAVILATLSLVSANAPPSCVLACAAEVAKKSCDNLGDLKCIVETNGSTLNSCLDSKCGDFKDEAEEAVKSAANSKGVKYNGSGSSSSSSSSSSSATSSSAPASSSAAATSEASTEAASSSAPSSSASAAPEASSSAAPETSSESAGAAPTTSEAASSSEAPIVAPTGESSAPVLGNGAPAKEIAGAIAAVAVGAALL